MLFKKVNSFTLTETLVALLLMVIIVGIASTIVNLTSQNIRIIKQNENGYRDLEQLELLLEIDFSRSKSVVIVDSTLLFKSPVQNITYTFNQTSIDDSRNLMRGQDTLLKRGFELEFFKNGKGTTKGLLDAIEVQLTKTDHFIFVTKPNDLITELRPYGF
ncbi:PulJ/GspJ family protein [Nonlabens xiamenensis]|uniref:PulJ/GspJ family protein n=1 Tax=Nonlabens xiamenensis TaxID=2341043 RepID=UPI000F606021|nr:hypothetical protein [Nonlabens xiamenensis]